MFQLTVLSPRLLWMVQKECSHPKEIFMKCSLLLAGCSVIALSAAVGAEPPHGRLFAFHSGATGACPAMDWHIVLEADNSLSGIIGWDGMKHLAKVSGKLETGRMFKLAAVEQGGAGRTGTVKGQVEDTFIVASFDGTATGCDNQQIWVPYFASGMAGGGGG
jgi:hypothetical protein